METSSIMDIEEQFIMAKLSYLVLYYNLGSEMIYILNQRLIAQNICPQKAAQVLNDIAMSLISSKDICLSSFLSSSQSCRLTPSLIKATFQSVISSSPLMRLSGESYDKLFDLMVGVFKYQVSLVPFPASIHFVTWNHFKSILELDNVLSKDTWTGMKNMADAYMSTFEQLTRSEWAELRNVLLNSFFGDIRTRVSILLREGCQDMESGHYVIPSIGSDTYGVSEKFEGRIVHYNDDGSVNEEFGHFEPGDEGTNLGFDIYASELDEKPSKCEGYNCLSNKNSTGEHETRLLASLLGRSESLTEHFNIEFDFQDGDHESNSSSSKQPLDLVKSKQLMSTLHTPKVFDEDQHSPANEDEGNDFLLLMDS